MTKAIRLLAALTLACALSACGGGDTSGTPQLDSAVAEQLAARSDAVADAIEANDGCAAAERVSELRAALDETTVPDDIRREVERVAGREFVCVEEQPPAVLKQPPVGDGDDDGRDKQKWKDKQKKHKGKKHGHDDDEDEDDD